VEDEISLLKKGKAKDKQGVLAEMIKCGGKRLAEALQMVFNEIISPSGEPPESWKTSLITILHKDGDQQLPSNYRPISVIKLLYKLFARLVLARMKKGLEEEQSVDQAGFRSGYGTDDHLFTLSQPQEKSEEWRQEVWFVFVDFRKAFDTVEHRCVWNALARQGITKGYISILRRLYRSSTGKIVLDVMSKEFNIERGVMQGDPLISPVLFNAVLADVFRELKVQVATECGLRRWK
jgi:sorting nexin-29